MNRICISNFGMLPLIAKTFWKVPKYLPDNPAMESFNKMISIKGKNFNSICSFSHKYDEVDRNAIVKSELKFQSNDHKLEEICEYVSFENRKSLIIKYIFDDLHNVELNIYKKIDDVNIYKSLTSGSQQILKIIDFQIRENKNNYIVN